MTGEKVYLTPTSKNEKESIKKILSKELINTKIASIQLSERTDAYVTINLFWKYDKYCSENGQKGCSVWGDWLHKYSESRKRDLKRLISDSKERSYLCGAAIQRKKYLVSLFYFILFYGIFPMNFTTGFFYGYLILSFF